jgi:hypothetical protein
MKINAEQFALNPGVDTDPSPCFTYSNMAAIQCIIESEKHIQVLFSQDPRRPIKHWIILLVSGYI